jgi:hypothetical protein
VRQYATPFDERRAEIGQVRKLATRRYRTALNLEQTYAGLHLCSRCRLEAVVACTGMSGNDEPTAVMCGIQKTAG